LHLRLARRRARGRRGFPPGPVPGVLDRRDLDPQPLTRSTRAPAGSPDGGVRVFEVFAPYGPESHAERFDPLPGITYPVDPWSCVTRHLRGSHMTLPYEPAPDGEHDGRLGIELDRGSRLSDYASRQVHIEPERTDHDRDPTRPEGDPLHHPEP